MNEDDLQPQNGRADVSEKMTEKQIIRELLQMIKAHQHALAEIEMRQLINRVTLRQVMKSVGAREPDIRDEIDAALNCMRADFEARALVKSHPLTDAALDEISSLLGKEPGPPRMCFDLIQGGLTGRIGGLE